MIQYSVLERRLTSRVAKIPEDLPSKVGALLLLNSLIRTKQSEKKTLGVNVYKANKAFKRRPLFKDFQKRGQERS